MIAPGLLESRGLYDEGIQADVDKIEDTLMEEEKGDIMADFKHMVTAVQGFENSEVVQELVKEVIAAKDYGAPKTAQHH